MSRRRRRSWAARIFLGLFTAFGAFIAVAVAIDWLQGVATYFWTETACTVERSSVVERPETGEWELVVGYRYHARGETRTGDRFRHGYTGSSSVAETRRLAARYAAGETVPCWYDSGEPARAYLRRANLWDGLWIFVPLLFVAVGAGALWMFHAWDREPAAAAETPVGAGSRARAAARPIRTTTAMIILFGAFFLFGFGMFVPFFVWPAMQVVAARSWTPVPCEIVSSGVRTHAGDDGATYSVEAVYRYEIGGREYVANRYRFMGGSSSGYESKSKAVEAIPAGARTECFVDPDDPYEAVIDRGFGADYLFGLIPLLFGLIGAGGLFVALSMARAARKTAERPSWSPPAAVAATAAPTLGGPMTLEPRLGPVGKVAGSLLLALFWNGIVSIFLWQLIKSWRSGSPDWLLALFLTPFVLIGVLLLAGVPYSILALVNPRPRLRLSSPVLRAGSSVQIDWSFRGAASRLSALKIWLEAASGTTSERRAGAEPLRTVAVVDLGPGLPLDFGSASVTLPADAEPTSDDGAGTRWKLKLHGRIDGWPDVVEEYEIRVEPVDGNRHS